MDRRRVVQGVLVVSGLWLGAGVARAQTTPTCSFDSATATVSVVTNSRRSNIAAVAATGQIQLNGAPCGGATVINTDQIEVTGPDTVDVVILTGRFAPGMSPEADGESEIEIAISLGWGSNTVRMNLSNGHDRLAITGSGRFDIGDDGDEDIAVVDTLNLQLIIDGRGGNDRIDASGGVGVYVLGGPGNDVLIGSNSDDQLEGDDGNDSIFGGPGDDSIVGGDGDDLADGEDGDDTIAEQDHVNGADDLRGGAGVDLVSYYGRATGVSVTIGNGLADDGAPGSGPPRSP